MEKAIRILGLTLTNLAADVIMLLPVTVLPVNTIWLSLEYQYFN